MAITSTPNEVNNKTFLLATETVPGTFVTPTARMFVPYSASPGVGAIKRSQDMTGGYDRTAKVARDFADPSATFGGTATFEELAIAAKYAIKGGVTGSASGSGYEYVFAPTFNADDISTFSALFGVDGLPWQSTGNRFDEFNISGDATSADNSWQIGGTPFLSEAKRYETGAFEITATGGSTTTAEDSGQSWTPDDLIGQYVFHDYGSGIGEVRQISDNDATTITVSTAFSSAVTASDKLYISAAFPTIAIPTYETIEFEGTNFFLDVYNESASTLGTTNISDRALSFNITQTLGLANKRRASGIIGRKGRGAREVTGTLRFEFDRWDEYVKWIENEEVSIRIEKTGPEISGGTHHKATIDIERAVFDAWTEDADNNNMTVSLTFVALLESPVWQVTVITDLATLP